MKTKHVAVDFGDRQIEITVPRRAHVVEFKDPPRLKAPVAAVRQALAEPNGSPPLAALVKPGMRVAIGFDDPGRPPAPGHVILPTVVDVLLKRRGQGRGHPLHLGQWQPPQVDAE